MATGIFRLKQHEEDLSLWSVHIEAGDDTELLSVGGLSMELTLPDTLFIQDATLAEGMDPDDWDITVGDVSFQLGSSVGAQIDVDQDADLQVVDVAMTDTTNVSALLVQGTEIGGEPISWSVEIIGVGGLIGCMDATACNYDPNAVIPCVGCCLYFDCEGVCDGGAIEDCAGDCNGDAEVGCDDICSDPPAVVDECGVCNGPGATFLCPDGEYACSEEECGEEPPIEEPGDSCEDAPIWDITQIAETYEDCDECNRLCYKVTDCENPEHIIATSDPAFAIYVGHVIKYIDPIDGLEYCGLVEAYVCRKEFHEIVVIEVISCFDDCEECEYTPPEPEKDFAQRSVYPGYDTPACRIEVYDKTLCQWSEALYQNMATKRYGIEFCCDPAEQKWHIKKELLALAAIYDPELCETKCERNFIAEPCCESIENPEWLLPNGEVTDLTPEGPVAHCGEFLNTIYQCGEQFRECVLGGGDPLACMEIFSVQTQDCCQRVIQWKFCDSDQYIWFVQNGNTFTVYQIVCDPAGACAIFTAEECCGEEMIEVLYGETGILTIIAGVVVEYGLDPNLIMEPYYEDGNCLLPCITQTEIVEMPASTLIGTVIKDTKGDCYTLLELIDDPITITWSETFVTCELCNPVIPPPEGCTCQLIRVVNKMEEGSHGVSYGDCEGNEVLYSLAPYQYKEFCVDITLPYDFSDESLIYNLTEIKCCDPVEPNCCFELTAKNNSFIDVAEFTYLPCGEEQEITIILLLGEEATVCIDLCNYQIVPQFGIDINWHGLEIPCEPEEG